MNRMLPLAFALLFLTACATTRVAQGDTVSVTYTGTYQNGTVFDSNDPAHAEDVAQRPASSLVPMSVTVGQGRLIPGFEQALVGMKEGESKTVTIKAADAYGAYNAELVRMVPKTVSLPREVTLKRDVNIPLADLRTMTDKPIAPPMRFDTPNFEYLVVDANETTAQVRIIGVRNASFPLPGASWNSTLVNQTNTTLVFRHDIVDGDAVNTKEGPYLAHVNATAIRLDSELKAGMRLQTAQGIATVTDDTGASIKVDRNHPLAGFDLTFTIRVDAIQSKA